MPNVFQIYIYIYFFPTKFPTFRGRGYAPFVLATEKAWQFCCRYIWIDQYPTILIFNSPSFLRAILISLFCNGIFVTNVVSWPWHLYNKWGKVLYFSTILSTVVLVFYIIIRNREGIEKDYRICILLLVVH